MVQKHSIIHPFSNCFSLMWVSGRAAQHLVVIYIFALINSVYITVHNLHFQMKDISVPRERIRGHCPLLAGAAN